LRFAVELNQEERGLSEADVVDAIRRRSAHVSDPSSARSPQGEPGGRGRS
jgi:hypothetical protein